MGTRPLLVGLFCLLALTLLPSYASGQNAEISGVVRDASGGVLPGVAVEASSPALIEKARTVFTDGQGPFRVIALPAGGYRAQCAAAGFGTVIGQSITLAA